MERIYKINLKYSSFGLARLGFLSLAFSLFIFTLHSTTAILFLLSNTAHPTRCVTFHIIHNIIPIFTHTKQSILIQIKVNQPSRTIYSPPPPPKKERQMKRIQWIYLHTCMINLILHFDGKWLHWKFWTKKDAHIHGDIADKWKWWFGRLSRSEHSIWSKWSLSCVVNVESDERVLLSQELIQWQCDFVEHIN